MPEGGKPENLPHEDQGVNDLPRDRRVTLCTYKTLLLSEMGNLGRASWLTKVSAHMVLPKSRCVRGNVGVSMRNGPQLNPVYTAPLASAS